MTEGHEDDFLVRVRAQVMTRDESTEGWLPLAGGGLANVSIRKRAKLPPDVGGHEYIIYGQRISDQTVILSCVINRDLQYFKVMPTFHHWRAGKQRNGLTFQTAADARAFDKGIIHAYDDLIDDPNANSSTKTRRESSSSTTCPRLGMTRNSTPWTPALNKYDNQVGEDDVFMTLDLPLEPTESRTNSEGSGSQKSGDRQNIHYISCDKPSPPSTASGSGVGGVNGSGGLTTTSTTTITNTTNTTASSATTSDQQTIVPGDNYSYVQLTAVHDYNYPIVDEPVGGSIINARRESTCSLKKRSALDTMTSPAMKEATMPIKSRHRCRYCQELYTEEWNRRGMCEFAPDCFKSGLEAMSGLLCARCMLYHCMSDAEGETPSHPCECSGESGCTKRWIGLALLSLIVPCLWCYPPLRACHWIGMSCGICGGKHRPTV